MLLGSTDAIRTAKARLLGQGQGNNGSVVGVLDVLGNLIGLAGGYQGLDLLGILVAIGNCDDVAVLLCSHAFGGLDGQGIGNAQTCLQGIIAVDDAEVNVLAVKEGNEDSPAIQALAAALTSQEVKDFIDETYAGAVVPVF